MRVFLLAMSLFACSGGEVPAPWADVAQGDEAAEVAQDVGGEEVWQDVVADAAPDLGPEEVLAEAVTDELEVAGCPGGMWCQCEVSTS